MKAARLVLLLSAGFLLRSLSLFLWGSGGLDDYRKVEAGRRQLAANIEELKRINSGLRREVESLGSDPERVALEARRLGYFRAGERVVRFQGEVRQPSSFTLGSLVRVQLPRERQDWIWKMAGVAVPLAAYAFWSCAGGPLRRRIRQTSIAVRRGRGSGKARAPIVALGGRGSGKAGAPIVALEGRSSGKAGAPIVALEGRSSGKAGAPIVALEGRVSGKASEDRRR